MRSDYNKKTVHPSGEALSFLSFLIDYCSLRASLHYGEEVHRSVKNFSPRHGYLRQVGEDEKTIKNTSIFHWSWSSPEAKFLV